MKVKYIGETVPVALEKNKVYEALGYESDFIRVIDESGEDYLYDSDKFEIVEE